MQKAVSIVKQGISELKLLYALIELLRFKVFIAASY